MQTPSLGDSAQFEVSDMLEQLRTDRFLKKELGLAIVDAGHDRFCIRKLADSVEPGTE